MSASVIFCAAALALMLLPYVIIIGLCAVAVSRRSERGEEVRCGDRMATVSVIVCVSHEDVAELSKCVGTLSLALRDGDEAIFVADHAEPETVRWLKEASLAHEGIRMVENDGRKGKKTAQAQGVALAKSRIVMCADADCVFGGGCVDAVRRAAPAGGDFLLLLPVMMEGGRGLWGAMVEMEFVCLQVVTAGTAIMKIPTMANGAGMAFDRDLFTSHDSMSCYASGDDMFLLLHAIHAGADIRFLCRRDALIRTAGPRGIGAYLRQRTRWLAKAGGYSSAGGSAVAALAVIVFAAVMAWPVMAIFAVAGMAPWWLMAVAFAVKLIVDSATFAAGRRLWPSRASVAAALPLEAIYPLMTIVVAIRAALADKKRW